MTLPHNELSDHCKTVTEIKGYIANEALINDTYEWKSIPKKINWNDDFKKAFTNHLLGAEGKISEINQRIDAGLVNSTGKMIQELYENAAQSAPQNTYKAKSVGNRKRKKCSKLWFDKDCNNIKVEIRKLGREKQKDQSNLFLREIYANKMREFKRTCQSKRYRFWKDKFELIENSLKDSKAFWENWKKCSETPSSQIKSKITGTEWFTHFSKLHTENTHKNVPNALTNGVLLSNSLNEPFTKNEFADVIKGLKNNKASGVDRISNEMLKHSPDNILNIILKYINICLKNAMVSDTICFDLITPLFKDGLLDDPNNYRGLCVSSALLKLICSLINNRLQKFVDRNNLISKKSNRV